MIGVNSVTAIVTPLSVGLIQKATPGFPAWVVWPLGLGCLFNVVCAIALMNWKRWGFYGAALTSVIAFALNVYSGLPAGQCLLGFIGIAILYGVLQMGVPQSGWSQMEG